MAEKDDIEAPHKHKTKPSTLRALCALAVFVVVGVGLAFETGLGTPSSFGWDSIATICPLGSLETMLAQGSVGVRGLLCLAITIALILLFGRAFCGWFCPTPLIRRVFTGKKRADKDCSDLKDVCASGCAACGKNCFAKKTVIGVEDSADAASNAKSGVEDSADAASNAKSGKQSVRSIKARIKNSPLDSRHAVLIGALASTAIFGFPVFCLVCPVGLSIATFIAFWQLVQLNETTLSLIVFPAILILELTVLRKWCHRFCPLSALASLVAKGNRTFRPTVNPTKCVRERGESECHLCYFACPEAIDLHDLAAGAPFSECMKCRECIVACPESAILIPLAPVRVKAGTSVRLEGVLEKDQR